MTASRLHRWSPALRRALMKVRPDYFGWSPAERERYGVAIPEEDYERLCQALLQELWNRKIRSPKAAARAASGLPLDEQHRWNEIVLPLTGIGNDCFFLNEGFAAGKSILDFPTLLAYDESDYRFQEEARRKDDSTYQGGAYRGSLYLTWARLFVGACAVHLRDPIDGSEIHPQLPVPLGLCRPLTSDDGVCSHCHQWVT